MFRKYGVLWTAMLLALLLLAGCSGEKDMAGEQTEAPNEPLVEEVSNEPVELVFYAKLSISEGDFDMYIGNPVKDKFPHVTFQVIRSTSPRDLVVSGAAPDLIWEGLTNIHGLTEFDLPMGMDELVQKHNFDLSRFDPNVTAFIRSFSDKGELIYLPYRIYPWVTHYNKRIFDLFGTPYPENGMTWNDAVELARRLSRHHDGVDYRGLTGGVNLNRTHTQISLNFVDPATEKSVLLTNPKWQELFQLYHRIYNVPGNYPEGARFNDGVASFLDRQVLAMFPHIALLGNGNFVEAANKGLDWGISTYPEWPGQPGVGAGIISDGLIISNTSRNKDVAFQVLAHLLSDEVQRESAKLGNPTSLLSPDVRKHMYEASSIIEGKDLSAIYALSSPEPYATTRYDARANSLTLAKLQLYYTGQLDLNTALREADEEVNRMIEAEKNNR